MLYDIQSIKSKVEKLYARGEIFRYCMQREPSFYHSINLQKPTQKRVLENLNTLFKEIENLEKLGIKLEYKEFSFKSIGTQRLPVRLVFESLDEYVYFIGKKEEFSKFCLAYEKAVSKFYRLKELFFQKPKLLLDNMERLEQILLVCIFLEKNPQPNIYIRELSIQGVDTKFVEKNRAVIDIFLTYILSSDRYDSSIERLSEHGLEKKYGLKYEEPLVRFRLLDENLYINNMSDISLPISEFQKLDIACENIFIIENKITTLSFPNTKNSIVIFGKGYAIGILKNVTWMKKKTLYYWGDIDMDGYSILSQVRGYFKHVKSFLMDSETLEQFADLAVSSQIKKYRKLAYLSRQEHIIYERLNSDYYKENFRLEQERIPFQYLRQKLQGINDIEIKYTQQLSKDLL